MISYNYLVDKKHQAYALLNLKLYESETPENISDNSNNDSSVENDGTAIESDEKSETSNKKVSYNYIGTLHIDKIKLNKGFLDLNSPYNNVDRNITVIEKATYPNVENSNLIIAAHSGDCPVCYFDKLYKLELGDKASVKYKNKRYIYELVNVYNVEKNGTVEVRRDPSKKTLTLITCTHNSDTEQTVYIFELQKEDKI